MRAVCRVVIAWSLVDEVIVFPPFPDSASAPDPESRDSGFDAEPVIGRAFAGPVGIAPGTARRRPCQTRRQARRVRAAPSGELDRGDAGRNKKEKETTCCALVRDLTARFSRRSLSPPRSARQPPRPPKPFSSTQKS